MDDRGTGSYERPHERTSPHRIPASRGGAGLRQHALLNQFTLDDGLYIMRNPQVTQFSWRGLLAANRVTHRVPAAHLCHFGVQLGAEGAHPLGYHLLNLLLHAAVTLLLYLLLCALLEETANGKTVALVAAVLFAVHPIHTEAVASIVGRSELLAAGFLLGAWILHLRDREIPALLCFSLALLSKESAVAFLPLVLVGDYARAKWKPPVRYARIAWRHRALRRAALEGSRRPLRPGRHSRHSIIRSLRFRPGGEFSTRFA